MKNTIVLMSILACMYSVIVYAYWSVVKTDRFRTAVCKINGALAREAWKKGVPGRKGTLFAVDLLEKFATRPIVLDLIPIVLTMRRRPDSEQGCSMKSKDDGFSGTICLKAEADVKNLLYRYIFRLSIPGNIARMLTNARWRDRIVELVFCRMFAITDVENKLKNIIERRLKDEDEQ